MARPPKLDANKFTVVKPPAAPATSRLALLDQIGALHALKSELVTLDGPDGTPSGVVVEVRELTLGARLAIGEDASEPAGQDEEGNELTRTKMSVFMPRMIQATCYDPASGEPLWTDPEGVKALPQRVTAPLFAAALRVSGQESADEEDEPGNGDSGATDTGSISSPTS